MDLRMSRREQLSVCAAVIAGVSGCLGGGSDSFSGPFERDVDPSSTYLRTNNDDAGDAEPIDIEGLGVSPGQTLVIGRKGSFTGSSGRLGMTGVFSGSAELGPSDTRDRVADAIDAGDDYETSPTFEGDRPTDIPEDFLISDNEGEKESVEVTVPEGATHLFVAAIDNYYQDNSHGETTFGVRIESAE